uniref:Uncharacterized protein n=1 Tax=Meloidogyne javanica TaxID=6303 RepID=A0A915MFX9_MELJA
MHPGEGPGSHSGWINFGEGSVSQPAGMNQGEGPSGPGSKQPMNLDKEIHKLLQVVGDSEAHPEIRRRQLKNQGNVQEIRNIGEQYQNLDIEYNELQGEFENVFQEIKDKHKAAINSRIRPETLNEISSEIDKLVTRLQKIQAEQHEIIEDRKKIYNHLNEAERKHRHAEASRRYRKRRRDLRAGNHESGSNN